MLQPLELWNADERGGIALPALLVISPRGRELVRETSRDFADRVHDDDVLEDLESEDLPAIDVPAPWSPQVAIPDEDSDALSGAFSPQAFVPLMNGNRFGAIALAQRIEHAESRHEIKRHAAMAKSFLDAWKERRQA